MKKTRPLGQVLLELEVVMEELVEVHELQMGDILNLVRGHLEIHHPECVEEYISGGKPVMYYGPAEGIK